MLLRGILVAVGQKMRCILFRRAFDAFDVHTINTQAYLRLDLTSLHVTPIAPKTLNLRPAPPKWTHPLKGLEIDADLILRSTIIGVLGQPRRLGIRVTRLPPVHVRET